MSAHAHRSEPRATIIILSAIVPRTHLRFVIRAFPICLRLVIFALPALSLLSRLLDPFCAVHPPNRPRAEDIPIAQSSVRLPPRPPPTRPTSPCLIFLFLITSLGGPL